MFLCYFYYIFTIYSFFIHISFIYACYSKITFKGVIPVISEDMVVIALHILINFFIIASGVPDAGGTPHFRAFLKGLPVNNVFLS